MKRQYVITLVLALCGTVVAAAEPAGVAEKIAPFVDETTLVISYIDLRRTDPQAIQDWLLEATKDVVPKEAVAAEIQHSTVAPSDFRRHLLDAGATELFQLINLPADDARRGPADLLIVPLAEKSDAEGISRLLASGKPNGPATEHGRTARVVRTAVVCGSDAAMQALEQNPPVDRPELVEALGGEAPIRIALTASEAVRQRIEQMMPQLPAPLGGGPTADVTRGIRWASLSFGLPPNASARLLIQAENAESAARIGEIAVNAVQAVQNEGVPLDVAMLQPVVQGDRVVVEKNADELRQLASQVVPIVVRAQQNALRVRSMSNIRQILVACHMYKTQNKGEWPPDLQSLVDQKFLNTDHVLRNPRGQEDGKYVYIRPPGEGEENAQTRVVVYEELKTMPEFVNVGFADGHVEAVPQARAKAIIDDATKAAR